MLRGVALASRDIDGKPLHCTRHSETGRASSGTPILRRGSRLIASLRFGKRWSKPIEKARRAPPDIVPGRRYDSISFSTALQNNNTPSNHAGQIALLNKLVALQRARPQCF